MIRRAHALAPALLFLAGVGACARRSPAPRPLAEPALDASGLESSISPLAVASAESESGSPFTALAPPPAGESHRTILAHVESDELLRSQRTALRDHFGDRAIGPFQVQRAALATGATALLVSRADDSDPIVLVVDRDRLEWEKPRPTAGIVPPLPHLTLAPRPDGGVALFVWVATLRTVAARMWADDGNAFGDFEVFKPEACDALSVAYAPLMGWLVACSSPSGVRVARLGQDATVAFGPDGEALGSSGSVGPATIALDSPSSFMLIERAAGVGGDRMLAFRYDPSARPLWPGPIDLGRAVEARSGRAEATTVRDGVIHVQWDRRSPDARGSSAEIASSGELGRVVR